MAKRDVSNILGCIKGMTHHTDPFKVKQMLICDRFTPDYVEYRFRIVRDDCLTVTKQLMLVKQALEEGDAQKALALLEEKTLPCGHEEDQKSQDTLVL